MEELRIVTYNVHRCRGLDRRVRPGRIVEVLGELNADVIALQEVMSCSGPTREADQARFIAEELGMSYSMGENHRVGGCPFGNVVLSRFRHRRIKNYDLSVRGRQRRGCLRADLELARGRLLHVFNVHLGTAYLERRLQGPRLVDSAILNNHELEGSRIMLGDFNEWARGLTTRLLGAHLRSADIRKHLRRGRTYPGVLPFLHLDHIYFDESLELRDVSLDRSRRALVASDHLPLVADLRLRPGSSARNGQPARSMP